MEPDIIGRNIGKHWLRPMVGNFQRLLKLAELTLVLAFSRSHVVLKVICWLDTNVRFQSLSELVSVDRPCIVLFVKAEK